MAKNRRFKHGEYVGGTESPEHYVWRSMFRRSKHPNGHYYSDVTVCERWKSFSAFLEDMGRRPSPLHSIDRIDNNGNYEPENCRWATRSEQQKNKRTTRRWLHNGKAGTLSEWAEHLGISRPLALDRWKRWGTFEKGKSWELLQRGE